MPLQRSFSAAKDLASQQLRERPRPPGNRIPPNGIGAGHSRPDPSHTTRHAGPHRAVRKVEVRRTGSPARSCNTAPPPLGSFAHAAPVQLHRAQLLTQLRRACPPCAPARLAAPRESDAMPHQASSLVTVLPVRPFVVLSGSTPAPTTTASADFSLHLLGCRAFTHKARSPQVRTRSFTAQPPHLRRLACGHKSFAVDSLLALAGNASYPVLVHRLTVYAPRFLPTLGHPHAVALHLPRCGQLSRGLAPRRSRPCWAHCPPPTRLPTQARRLRLDLRDSVTRHPRPQTVCVRAKSQKPRVAVISATPSWLCL